MTGLYCTFLNDEKVHRIGLHTEIPREIERPYPVFLIRDVKIPLFCRSIIRSSVLVMNPNLLEFQLARN